MDFRAKQIAPPKNWDLFEELCLGLFRVIWRDPLAVRHGRSGQAQHGVDIFGSLEGREIVSCGVQCKGKDQAYGGVPTLTDLNNEIAKAERFSPPLNQFILVTTAPRDSRLQAAARQISRKRAAAGKFSVRVLGWEDVQSLLADAPIVLQSFYPEHVLDIQSIVNALRDLPSGSEVRALRDTLYSLAIAPASSAATKWIPVTFSTKRDLGPALMGRPLGPADAVACPLLPEAKTIVQDLRRGYYSRLAGEAGVGKSVCAYQAAHLLAAQGWRVLRLADPNVTEIALAATDVPTLYLMDDAHLMPPWVLAAAEAEATEIRAVLSTHNVAEHASAGRDAIKLDAARAVRVIASTLRANLPATLKIVRRVDDSVGEQPLSESLPHRIDHAETVADRPWQFCFVLGGGWRRAEQAAQNARVQNADIALAAAAIRQIASRDARCSRLEILDFLQSAGVAIADAAWPWLIQERLLIAADDNRTPHQRFASVVIGQILRGQSDTGRGQIAALYDAALRSPDMPLIGLRNLLLELRLTQMGQWRGLVSADSLGAALQRCWQASEAQRAGALFFLSEASGYLSTWPRGVLEDHLDLIGEWISQAARQSCYALGRLLNDVFNADKAYAGTLIDRALPRRVAVALGTVTPSGSYEMGALLSALANGASPAWKKNFKAALPREALLRLARRWPDTETIESLAKLASTLHAFDKSLSLDMVSAFVPHAVKALADDPASAFHAFTDVAWHVIKGFDLLGIYKDHPQTARERNLCRKLCAPLKPLALAAKLSRTDKRDFQAAAQFLGFLRNSAPRKFARVVREMDWSRIDQTIGSDWKRLNHEADVLLWIAHRDQIAKRTISDLIERRLPDIEVLTPKLAIMSPAAAQKQVAAGRRIGLSSLNGHFHWPEAFIVLGQLYEARPDLVDILLESLVPDASRVLSLEHPSWYRDGALFVQLLRQIAPNSVQDILNGVDAAKAEKGWSEALVGGDDMRRPIALLIESAIGRDDAVGTLAKRLRARFGVSSQPDKNDLKRLIF